MCYPPRLLQISQKAYSQLIRGTDCSGKVNAGLLGALKLKQDGILPSTWLALASYSLHLPFSEGETAGVTGLCSLQVICEGKLWPIPWSPAAF